MLTPPPPLTALGDLPAQLASAGFAVLDAASLAQLAALDVTTVAGWAHHWDGLPPDEHLRDGGRYRRRRHGCFVVDGSRVEPAPHRAHWQPVEYNALHGGIERWFEPLAPEMAADAAFLRLLQGLARNRTIIASWAGEYQGDVLSYGQPGHPEHQRHRNPDAVIVPIIPTHGAQSAAGNKEAK